MSGHKIASEDSNTRSKTITCECGWSSGSWPCDGSAEYDHYLHAASQNTENEKEPK